MKKKNKGFKTAIVAFSALCIGTLMVTSCNKKKENSPQPVNAIYDVTSSLDGKQASTDSKGTAMLTATYTQSTKKLSYKIAFTGIEPASIDIHDGSRTAMGKKLLSIPKNANARYTSPVNGEITLTAEQEKALLKGPAASLIYINIITQQITKGEIRGTFTTKRKP